MKDLATIIKENEAAVIKALGASAGKLTITIEVEPKAVEPEVGAVSATDYPDVLGQDFYSFGVKIGKDLTPDEVGKVSGTIGYAFREVLAGEDLSNPDTLHETGYTKLAFSYDSTKSRRDDPDFQEAFSKAEKYIREGSPVRSTNRAGAGTKGTRLVEGIGPVSVEFYFQVTKGEYEALVSAKKAAKVPTVAEIGVAVGDILEVYPGSYRTVSKFHLGLFTDNLYVDFDGYATGYPIRALQSAKVKSKGFGRRRNN